MTSTKRTQPSVLWGVVGLCLLAVTIVAAVVVLSRQPNSEIDSFQACKDAGGAIAESYPEQCFINGKSFTNGEQSVDGKSNEYVGLAEQAALDRAKQENKASRVVERDGESLPVTADFSPGRLNFSVKDGKVYKVQVESPEN